MAEATDALRSAILDAASAERPLSIRGMGSKDFLGHPVEGAPLETLSCQGIVDYEPSELVLTARAGTPLADVESALLAEGQMLAFEPPRPGGAGTIGGAVAAGLSGPARPYRGAVRDFVLGCQVLDGRGRLLTFGGRVMKNVAGYDISRLLAGSMGCLAVIVEVSLKVLPVPSTERTVALECDQTKAIREMCRLGALPLPLSGATWSEGVLHLRLAGAEAAVSAARNAIGGDEVDSGHWALVRNQRAGPFAASAPLWRLSVPAATPPLDLAGHQLIDWGGAQRWLATDQPAAIVRAAASAAGGHATRFRGGDPNTPVFEPLPATLLALHRRIKAALDPDGLFNPGRMYEAL